jgi:hypothetical protein
VFRLSWTNEQRRTDARRLARREIGKLKTAADRLALTSEAAWLSPYGIGYLWRHIIRAQEKAKWRFWNGWFGPRLPSDEEVRQIALEVVPAVLGISGAAFQIIYDDQLGADPLGSEFEDGVGDADRSLSAADGTMPSTDDRWGMRIAQFAHDYRVLPGRYFLLRRSGQFAPSLYTYLVARTLGERAFRAAHSNEELASLISFRFP